MLKTKKMESFANLQKYKVETQAERRTAIIETKILCSTRSLKKPKIIFADGRTIPDIIPKEKEKAGSTNDFIHKFQILTYVQSHIHIRIDEPHGKRFVICADGRINDDERHSIHEEDPEFAPG